MIILNINGPINSGKTTVSRLLVNMLPGAKFVEVDDLLSDAEEKQLGLSMSDGWAERLNRLDKVIRADKKSNQYTTIIFAYPMTDGLYKRWAAHADTNTRFIAVTLAPDLEICLTNRGTRALTEWETNRIREMYATGYARPTHTNLVINNGTQTPQQTAREIARFLQTYQTPQK